MIDRSRSLANLNDNPNYDLKNCAAFLFENDDWPNPYLDINIHSNFYDRESFSDTYANKNHPLFLSINIQSLMSKHEQLKNYILNLINSNVPIYVIAVQEIWSIQYADLVEIPGFRFIYKNRTQGRGGGRWILHQRWCTV
jgi:hypothetical protein